MRIDDLYSLEQMAQGIDKTVSMGYMHEDDVKVTLTSIEGLGLEVFDDNFSDLSLTKAILQAFKHGFRQMIIAVTYNKDVAVTEFDMTDFDIDVCDIKEILDVTCYHGYEVAAIDPTERCIAQDKIYWFNDISMCFEGPYENESDIFIELYTDFSND